MTWCTGTEWRDAANSAISAGVDYLIIATEGLSTSLVQEYAEHRANFNGFNVAIATMDQIDDNATTDVTPDTIRAFLKTIYDEKCASHMADSLIGYVLLLGDATDPSGTVLIPGYYGFPYSYNRPSDAYYSFLSEESAAFDYFADVYIGRIPVDIVSGDTVPDPDWELRNVVNKTKSYRPDSVQTKRILLVSGTDVGVIDDYKDYFQNIIDSYIPNYIDGGSVSVDTIHRTEYPIRRTYDETFSDKVAQKLEDNGHWILGLIGHGAPYYLGQSFYPKHYDVIQNTAPYPLVLTYGCDLGRYDMEIDQGPFCCLSTSSSSISCFTPTTALDTCDAFSERVLLQENGAIGVIAFAREPFLTEIRSAFDYYYKSIFEDNAYSLGEILLSTRFHLFPSIFNITEYAMTIFGDPALNIVWENYAAATVDSTDIVIRQKDIEFTNAVGNLYIDPSTSLNAQVKVLNAWHTDAQNVPVEIWDGSPGDSSSSLLARDTLAVVPAYGSSVATLDVGSLSIGEHRIYVNLDTTVYSEPSYSNNTAFRVIRVYDYLDGYPVKLNSFGTHSVTIADVNKSYSGNEILVNTGNRLICRSSDGQELWYKHSTTYADKAGYVNGTPLVADVYKNGDKYCLYLDKKLFVLDGTGTPQDTVVLEGGHHGLDFQAAYKNHHGQTMTAADVYPGDESLELVFRRRDYWVGSQGLYIACYNIETSEKKWEVQIETMDHWDYPCEIAAADVDGDGLLEIAARTTGVDTSFTDSLYVYENDGERRWSKGVSTHDLVSRNDVYENESVATIPAGIAADGSVLMDIVVTKIIDDRIFLQKYDAESGDITWLISDRGRDAYISTGDVDNDGVIEVVMSYMDPITKNGQLRIISSKDGSIEDSVTTDDRLLVMPLVTNVDTDDEAEILVMVDRRNEHLPDESEYVLQVREHDLSLTKEISFRYNGRYLYQQRFDYNVVPAAMPAVDDVDLDGFADVALVTPDSILHVIKVGPNGTNEWAQRYKNPAQTNNYRQIMGGEYSVDVSIMGDVALVTDAVFREDVYITPGTDVLISDEDQGETGVDTLAVEMHVYGALEAKGTETHPIRFVAWDGQDESTNKDDWWGIFVHDSTATPASATFEHCEIKNAKKAIGTNVDITIKDCTIEMCDLIGVSIARADSVHIENTTIRDTDLVGINLLWNSAARVTGCTIENMDSYGVEVYSAAKLYADDSEFRNCDIGIYAQIGDSMTVYAEIVDCELTSNDIGLKAYRTSDVTVDSCVIDSNATDGIYCLDDASINIEDNTIRYNTIGIYCNDYSDATIKDNIIRYNTAGGAIKCDDYSHAVIEGNVITSNKVGIAALNNASPDIGHTSGGLSQGNNQIHSNTSFYVSNSTMGITLKAENNYWAGSETKYYNCLCDPSPRKIYGNVDVCDALCNA
ncbi:MAG: C25 family cysteine peptidase, partial [Planctomycetota bacterium]